MNGERQGGNGRAGSTGGADRSTVALFQDGWSIYRKMVDNNYLFHREAYGVLHQFLREEMRRPFRFLDIACGDASASISALKGTEIAHYHGIDFSEAALAIARKNLAVLECPVTLDERDFTTALSDGIPRPDIVWIGLSLHHLKHAENRCFMRKVRALLGGRGHFLIYEDASPDGESRERWLERWDEQKPDWTAYRGPEWDTVTAHVHAADFPETDGGWRKLGREAGFEHVSELFRAPTDLLRLYCFTP
jgi:hypothetical protein